MSRFQRGFFFWFPRDHKPVIKAEIIGGGVTEDVTSDLIIAEWRKISTVSTGDFKMELRNVDGRYSNKYVGEEAVKFYVDNDGGSTKMFEGFIDFPQEDGGSAGRTIQIEGRHIGGQLLEIMVTKEVDNQEISQVLIDLINDFAPSGFTSENVAVTSPQIIKSFRWQDRPFWDCVKELCEAAQADCYVDDDRDFHFFERKNAAILSNSPQTGDYIVYRQNLISLSGLGNDNYLKKNRIRVIGQDDIGQPIIFTVDTSGTGRVRSLPPFRETNLRTFEEVKTFALAKKAELESSITEGEALCRGLPNARPGDLIWVVNPITRVHGTFRIIELKHKIGSTIAKWNTTVRLAREENALSTIFRDILTRESLTQNFDNIHNLDFSFNNSFNDDSGLNLSGTKVQDGKLVLNTGQTSGTAESGVKTADVAITKINLRIIGKDLGDTTFQFSLLGGSGGTYENISINQLVAPINMGKILRWKAILKSTTLNPAPEIDSIALLYK